MSRRTMAVSLSKRNSARALASSVLPTPVVLVRVLAPAPFFPALPRLEPLADLLDVTQPGLLHLPLAPEVLELLLDLLDLQLDLGQPLARVLFFLAAEHPLGQLELEQP